MHSLNSYISMKIKIQSKHENQMEVKKSPTITQSIELCFIHFVHCTFIVWFMLLRWELMMAQNIGMGMQIGKNIPIHGNLQNRIIGLDNSQDMSGQGNEMFRITYNHLDKWLSRWWYLLLIRRLGKNNRLLQR